MTYKTRMCYVVMREQYTQLNVLDESYKVEQIPVAVFYDEETASGNAEGYNLEMQERNVPGIRFYVAVTCAYS